MYEQNMNVFLPSLTQMEEHIMIGENRAESLLSSQEETSCPKENARGMGSARC